MPQYIKHNFAENYKNYTKYGEIQLRNDMMLDELAKLIVFDKEGLIVAITTSGYNIVKKPKHNDFVLFFKEYIPKDKTLRENLAKLIILNNNQGDFIKNKKAEFDLSNKLNIGKYSYGKGGKEGAKETYKELGKSLHLNFTGKELDDRVTQHYANKLAMENKLVTKEELQKKIRATRIKTALLTGVILIGGYYGVKWLINKYPTINNYFKRGGQVCTNSSQDEVELKKTEILENAGGLNESASEFDEYGFRIKNE
jgi:hypothetical protein